MQKKETWLLLVQIFSNLTVVGADQRLTHVMFFLSDEA